MNEQRELNIALLKVVAELFFKKNATFVVVAGNDLNLLENYTETEKRLKEIIFNKNGVGERISWFKSIPEHFDALYADLPQYSKDYIEEIFTPIPNIDTRRGRANLDHKSNYVNITNGCRHTSGQPEVYDNSIFMVGSSSTYGFGCEDKHTLPSLFQELINNSNFLHSRYSVFNLGARGNPKFVDFYKLLNLNVSPNDIVVLHGVDLDIVEELSYLSSEKFHFILPDFSNRHSVGEIFFDSGHVTYKGHAIIAKQIFDSLFSYCIDTSQLKKQSNIIGLITEEKRNQALKALNTFTNKFRSLHSNLEKHPELQHFVDELKILNNKQGMNGAIVVNCNPFTLGHRHLIEYAASKVDNLFVFVVEENLSYFDFNSRLLMVIEGTKNIANVKVLPIGKYIMSTVTYPNYFSKEEAQTVDLDASTDMDIFGEHIAPALNIKVRFIGEEPSCNVTRQHNIQMRTILPTYGIKVEEIKRITYNGQIISASLVRNYIKNSEKHKIQSIVPQSTFEHIAQMMRT